MWRQTVTAVITQVPQRRLPPHFRINVSRRRQSPFVNPNFGGPVRSPRSGSQVVIPTLSQLKVAAEEMEKILEAEQPGLTPEERHSLAYKTAVDLAKQVVHEQLTGQKMVLICVCGDTDLETKHSKGHLFGTGKCRNPECACEEFIADRVATVEDDGAQSSSKPRLQKEP